MLNDRLAQQLHAADRGFQRQTAITVALRALKYVLGVVLLLFAVDVALQLGPGWRLAGGMAFLAGLLGLGALLFYIARVRRGRPEQVARELETRDPSLRSSLINFLQLREQLQRGGQPPVTRALTERALGDYATALERRDFSPLTRSPELKRDLRYAALAAAAAVAVLGILYPVTLPELLRFLDPFGDHPAYSYTQIEIVDPAGVLSVNYNGSALIKAQTHGHRPDDLYLIYADPARPGQRHAVPMYNKGEAGFLQAIENIKSDLVVYAATKNGRSVSKSRLVRVGLIPRLEHAFVEVSPPAYTGLKAHETAFDFKKLTALAGSQIKFRLQSNRPLSGGAIALPEGSPIALQPSAENEVSGLLTAKESARLQFSVVDTAGHASQENPSAPLTVTHDLPPEITIDTPTEDGFVCEDFTVEARLSASDDYGLKTIRIHRALNDVYSAPKTIEFPEITRSAAETVSFDIKALGVQPGDTLSLFAEAIDTCPEPHLARTRTLHLTVIGTGEYNDSLRERADISDIEGKYSALLNEFQDRVDEQKALTEKLRELEKEQAADPAAAKTLAPQLAKIMAEQAELNERLGALADRMEHFVRDQPLYDLEKELQKTLAEKAAQIRSSVAQNDEALKKSLEAAAEPSPPSGPAPQSLVDALASLEKESQRQADELQPEQKQAEEETMPPLKDAAAMNAIVNDFNAIKYLHEMQTALAAQAAAYQNRPAPSDEDRLALKQMGSTEKAMEYALAKVSDNLRAHADTAEKAFPQAAASARALAERVEEQRLSALAGRAAGAMLAGDGDPSAALAERLRQELDDLFEESKPGAGRMGNEFDRYLRLHRRLSPGRTFGQMSQSRKFGFGSGQTGNGEKGDGGLDGFASADGGSFSMFGKETLGGDPKSSGQGGNSAVPPPGGPGQKVASGGADSPGGPEVSRLSGSTRSESALDEYRGLIDAYFNSITK